MKRVLFNFYRALMLEQYVQEIITQQEVDGWAFDSEKAKDFLLQLEKMRDELYNYIRPHLSFNVKLPYKQTTVEPFTKAGKYTSVCSKWMGTDVNTVSGPFTRIVFEEPNLDSDKQLKEQLFKLGWKPDEWNYKKDKRGRIIYVNGKPTKTSPKLTESSYDSLTVGIGPDLAKYLKVSMRISTIEGWLKQLRSDGTISAKANSLGTPTARFRHSGVVNVPKAKPHVFFGKECRSLFIHRPGRKLVGHDASGLESRMEAHNTYDINREYAEEILHGDVHQKNADKWSEIAKKEIIRDIAKNGRYALGYGCHPPKLADTLDIILKKAQLIWDDFWSEGNPLNTLKRRLIKQLKKHKSIIGLDGRPIFVRKESAIINSKQQSDGAIVMKVSMVLLNHWRKKHKIDAIKVGDFHDEGQADVALHQADLYGKLAAQSIRKAGKLLKLNVPLDADYKVGDNWSETH